MTTSLTPSLAELVEDETRIPEETLVFLRERLRTMLHQLALREFLRQSKVQGLKKSSLAKKLDCGPELISRWLGRPGNREVDTVSDLLAAMGIIPMSVEVARAADLIAAEAAAEAHDRAASHSECDTEKEDSEESVDSEFSTEPYPSDGDLRVDSSEFGSATVA